MLSFDLILWNSTSFTLDAITVAADPISFSAAVEPVSNVITLEKENIQTVTSDLRLEIVDFSI